MGRRWRARLENGHIEQPPADSLGFASRSASQNAAGDLGETIHLTGMIALLFSRAITRKNYQFHHLCSSPMIAHHLPWVLDTVGLLLMQISLAQLSRQSHFHRRRL